METRKRSIKRQINMVARCINNQFPSAIIHENKIEEIRRDDGQKIILYVLAIGKNKDFSDAKSFYTEIDLHEKNNILIAFGRFKPRIYMVFAEMYFKNKGA